MWEQTVSALPAARLPPPTSLCPGTFSFVDLHARFIEEGSEPLLPAPSTLLPTGRRAAPPDADSRRQGLFASCVISQLPSRSGGFCRVSGWLLLLCPADCPSGPDSGVCGSRTCLFFTLNLPHPEQAGALGMHRGDFWSPCLWMLTPRGTQAGFKSHRVPSFWAGLPLPCPPAGL